MTTDLYTVRKYVSWVTLALLVILTIASIVNLHDMANLTHAAAGLTSWIVAIGIGATLTTLSYVASVTDGRTRATVTGFAIVAAFTSATLQVSLFQARGASTWVAVAFGAGVPFFEVALALTDSMLRRYVGHAATPEKAAQEAPQKTQRPTTPKSAIAPHSATPAQAVSQPVDTAQKPPVETVPFGAASSDAIKPVAASAVDLITIDLAGKGDTELAKLAGVSRQTINSWRNAGTLDAKLLARLTVAPVVSSNGVNVKEAHA